MKSFYTILRQFRETSMSEREKGEKFEMLMKGYLMTEPMYATQIEKVWMWKDFPYKNQFGGADLGIDLVAKTYDNLGGDYWAIQCKCYSENATIDKPEVDSFLSTSGKSFLVDGISTRFSNRLWISTTNHWNHNAEQTIKGQNPPVSRVSLSDLMFANIDWEKIESGVFGEQSQTEKHILKPHQEKAVNDAHNYFKTNDRGKLIMACGTGKTFTSLRLAEKETGGKGLVLFLVPSIALLGQVLKEWTTQSIKKIYPICVCSDAGVSKAKLNSDDTDISVVNLALPATTNIDEVIKRLSKIRESEHDGMTVVFSTYQSIDVIIEAQKKILSGVCDTLFSGDRNKCEFDLIICDEAHRTTGATLKGNEDSNFVKVHYNENIKAKKRVYMTATPRLYDDNSKSKAEQNDAILCSMDDETLYGQEIYRIGFGEAVNKSLLSDYKVLVLTVGEKSISPSLAKFLTDENGEMMVDDGGKIIGCINALSKKLLGDAKIVLQTDPAPMKRAVAFCQNIKVSQHISNLLNDGKEEYLKDISEEERGGLVNVVSQHIDGSMSAPVRDEKLLWLKTPAEDENECRLLTNVRCLSEGVDVPSLDAVLFLSSRKSQVDVVQSVGRVMRKAEGKKYGYIIIPVVVPEGVDANTALDNNERFKVVWDVLNALRAHDDRFNATVNKIDLNKKKPQQILFGTIGGDESDSGSTSSNVNAEQLSFQFEELSNTFYARMVQKVGNKRYWEQWANDVSDIAKQHIARIKGLMQEDGKPKKEFERFVKGLKKNINPSISEEEAIEMLSQHIITKPVFEALFENYSFVDSNPISQSIQRILGVMETYIPKEDNTKLERFYDSVRKRAEGIDNAEGKQRVIIELYDKFFKSAFPKVVEKLGIVYTPVEVVDYIIHSVADILKKEFGRSISDENVHILDPFTGTGTFITRLLQSGLIKAEDLERKYTKEIHANEIVLLAYYIASINIENVYHDMQKEGEQYKSFDGICLTDTFQLGEEKSADGVYADVFPNNSKRVQEQMKKPITVIIGNPPYSVGQKSANDNAQNQTYPILNKRLEQTYVALSTANNKNSLYDSYIKAFRWASDRISKNGGIIGFVSNGSWIDGNAQDGMRLYIEKEFSSIYVFNLRGNQRTSGELSRKEGGKIFGSGSRTPISITILVKKPQETSQKAKIFYHDIGDYLSREEKLRIVKEFKSLAGPKMEWKELEPNDKGDWINHRNEMFSTYTPMEPNKKFNVKSHSFFTVNSRGFETGRDLWVYNSAIHRIRTNIKTLTETYNKQIEDLSHLGESATEFVETDETRIKWTSSLLSSFIQKKKLSIQNNYREVIYRPFFKQMSYFGEMLIHRRGQMDAFFPTLDDHNLLIVISGVGGKTGFSSLLVNTIPDLGCMGACQCFPLYWYDDSASDVADLFNTASGGEIIKRYEKKDGISDYILRECRKKYGSKIIKEDIFYYVYGMLHSPEYRQTFEADLKKMLPRLPLVEKADDFFAFSKAGRALAELHLNYETVEMYDGVSINLSKESPSYMVNKMKFAKKDSKTADKSIIYYNNDITISDIPLEAYEYVVNGRSAIEWLMERYQITTDSKSGITNNPNDWATEHDDEKYIFNLILRIITVSIETMKIVKSLPKLKFE